MRKEKGREGGVTVAIPFRIWRNDEQEEGNESGKTNKNQSTSEKGGRVLFQRESKTGRAPPSDRKR